MYYNKDIKSIYANLLRIEIINFFHTSEFRYFLIEHDLDNTWETCTNSNRHKFDGDDLYINDSEYYIDYEGAFLQFLGSYLINAYSSTLNEEFSEFLLEFFRWKDQFFNLSRLEKSLKYKFGDDSNELLGKLNSLNDSIDLTSKKVENDPSISLEHKLDKTIKDIERYSFDNNSSAKNTIDTIVPQSSEKIFIVHGHDEVARYRLRDFLKNDLGLIPVIIQEEPNETFQTIISKFENSARDCSAAIILVTPDDQANGGYRARQNVILELGYFLGKWTEEKDRKIIIIKSGSTEIPSDIHGVIYHKYQDKIDAVFHDLRKQFKYWNYEIK